MKDPQEPRAAEPHIPKSDADFDRVIAEFLDTDSVDDGPPFPSYYERFKYYSIPRKVAS